MGWIWACMLCTAEWYNKTAYPAASCHKSNKKEQGDISESGPVTMNLDLRTVLE